MNKFKLIIGMLIMSVSFAASAMTFTVERFKDGGNFIFASGDIVRGDEIKLIKIMTKYPSVKTISLSSYGGRVLEAQAMAYEVWKRGISTFVARSNICASACTDMFMGGVRRAIFSGETRTLGYHAITMDTSDLTADEAFNTGQFAGISDATFLVAYVADGYEYAALSFYRKVHGRSNSDLMYWATADELVAAGIVTRVAE